VWCYWPVLYLSDLFFDQLQLVRFVGPQQLGLRLPLLLQRCLCVLPALPRLHPLIKRPLQAPPTQRQSEPVAAASCHNNGEGKRGSFWAVMDRNVLSTLTAPSRRM